MYRPGALSRSVLLLAVSVAVGGCQEAPKDLRPWQPSDHTNTGAGGSEAPATNRQTTGEAKTTIAGLDEVSIATWRANCVICHGTLGRADGPQSMIYKPRDLSDPEWQATVTDEQLYASIQQGKNKMPGFALPEHVARNLVKLVRLLDMNRQRGGSPEAPQSPSPGGGTGGSPSADAPNTP